MSGMTDGTSAGTSGTEIDGAAGGAAGGATSSPRVLLYSDDRAVREQVRLAVGPRLRAGAPDIEWIEAATPAAVVDKADNETWDLLVLDGEADQTGGMGLCRQLKNEIYDCPPVLILTGRPEDSWLASWSLADGVVSRPLDAIKVQEAVAKLLTVSQAVSQAVVGDTSGAVAGAVSGAGTA